MRLYNITIAFSKSKIVCISFHLKTAVIDAAQMVDGNKVLFS